MSDRLQLFAARFDSICNCGNAMDEGDQIARTPDGDYICGDCIEEWGE